jgi:hypothetical protein
MGTATDRKNQQLVTLKSKMIATSNADGTYSSIEIIGVLTQRSCVFSGADLRIAAVCHNGRAGEYE